MRSQGIISNDRQARELASTIKDISTCLESENVLRSVLAGVPHGIISGVRRALATEKRELEATLAAYELAKAGDIEQLKLRASGDLGALLIIARIARGWSQKELGRKLGLQEQAIQRYESEKYRGINLSGFVRLSRTLGVSLDIDFSRKDAQAWLPAYEMSPAEAQKILKHARARGWLEKDDGDDENALNQLKRHVAEHVDRHGTPSLLRTGLNVIDHSEDWALLAWKAQVTRRALRILSKKRMRFCLFDISWLLQLVKQSRFPDGPRRAQRLLEEQGIILIAEAHVSGMKVDGAAFLVEEVPVIALTLLRDSLDNFWFTLMHEIAHVVLHYRTGLSSGFFDDFESTQIDEFEREANAFATNLLIPDEVWSQSAARISKKPEPVQKFAEALEINPAIVFGRIRMERKNYTVFSDRIGRGQVRKQLFESEISS